MPKRYRDSCRKAFWQEVFQKEAEYLADPLHGLREVLSVGCGPADVEGQLIRRGFKVTGLDVSQEALHAVPEGLRAVVGCAEELPFADRSFDAVIFVASLQFVEDYRRAVVEAARVLRPAGRLIAMLLNPASEFYRGKRADPASYVNNLKHEDIRAIEKAVAERFRTETDYFLGIRDGTLVDSRDPVAAALYIVRGDLR